MKAFTKKYYVYILVMLAFYVAAPLLCRDTGSAMFTLLCLLPVILFILSLVYAKMNGFKWYLSIIIGLLWFPAIIYLNESATIYALIYGVISFIGQGIGFLINKIVKSGR
ncbi:MAG: hypothetical protein D8H95_44950 [Lachnospiraceae bacterium]|nr:MAG: hypothetical protein D8H95_44950 [Lachnospiraceae bacterium]